MRVITKAEIERNFNFDEAVRLIRQAYISTSLNKTSLAEVGLINFPQYNGDCHIKSGHILGDKFFVVKIATGFYDNPILGLPSSNGVMVVFSAENGKPLAILMDEGWLTDMRTGIGGAIATAALAPKNAENVLIVGTGIQSFLQLKCLSKIGKSNYKFNIWGRSSDKAELLCKKLELESIAASPVHNLETEVKKADIIITATQATEFIIKSSWVKPCTHITAVGADSPGKEELEMALISRADLLISDLVEQSLDHGEFQRISDKKLKANVVELGNMLNQSVRGGISDDSITIADLTGIAPQDIAITGSILSAIEGSI